MRAPTCGMVATVDDSGSVPGVPTPRRPVPLTEQERAEGERLAAEIVEMRKRHRREEATALAARNAWIVAMRAKYPDEHRLPAYLAAIAGMERSSVFSIIRTGGVNARSGS
jgi:hypothetical protein